MKKKSKKPLMNFVKSIIVLVIFLTISSSGQTQTVGMSPNGATPPNVSAGLDVNYTTQGMLIPRIALTGTANAAPLAAHVAGMVIYNTATTSDVTPGMYFNNGSKWITTIPKSTATGNMQYWNGNQWVDIPLGLPGQKLMINASGVKTWVL
jgi:hypothetical protein